MKLFLLFSHKLTDAQMREAEQNWGITEFVALPPDLQEKWENVPADLAYLNETIAHFTHWLANHAKESDYILIQGEFGLVVAMVNWCAKHALIPIYSTTERVYQNKVLEDGSTQNIHIVKHIRFRKYPVTL